MRIIAVFSIITVLLCDVCLSADPPLWIGIFDIDDSCNQSECCCLADQATITKVSDTQLLVSANVSGIPCQQQLNGSTTVKIPIPIPTDKSGFQITMDFLGTKNRFTLSPDSQYIANVNLQYPKCSGIAHRIDNNWLGKFDLDDSCDQTQCCCLVEQVKISKFGNVQLLVAGKVSGTTCGSHLKGSASVEIPIPIPTDKYGYQLTTAFIGSLNRFTLTYDNQYIANANLQAPACSGMARRNNGPF
jgi:hypothetical protein